MTYLDRFNRANLHTMNFNRIVVISVVRGYNIPHAPRRDLHKLVGVGEFIMDIFKPAFSWEKLEKKGLTLGVV